MFHKDLRGYDLHAPSNELVENNTGADIPPFKVVALDGMGAVYPQVEIANYNLKSAFGIVLKDQRTGQGLVNGKTGYVACMGFVFGLDTSAFTNGVPLYYDTAGNLTMTVPPITNPTPIAIVVRASAQYGVIYVIAMSDQIVANPGDWSIVGNNGLDYNNNFIGTTDLIPFRIKTNNTQRQIITEAGRFGFGTINTPLDFWHKKAHTGYGSSGRIETTASVTTFATSAANLWQFSVPDNAVVTVEVSASAINTVQGRSASIKRTAAFARIGGILSQVGNTQSDYTFRSTPGMKVQFVVDQIASTVTAQVLSDTAIETAWVGHISADMAQRNA